MPQLVECVGVLHVHSRYSDGTGSVEEILAAAKQAKLDFVVLADHDTLGARREGWERAHGDVTLIAATEITPHRQGHLLAMNVRRCEGYAVQLNRLTLDAILAQGGYAVVAHPLGKRKITLGINQTPWHGWDHPALRGMEIWSYTHDWVDGFNWLRLPQARELYCHPEQHVRGPYPEVLRLWDALGRRRRIAGLGGLDCHARPVPLSGLRIFPYARMFQFLRNHLFVPLEDWQSDPTGALWQALAEGRGFVAHDILADSKGARCSAAMPDGRELQPGQEAPFVPGTIMSIWLPREAEVRWIANGSCRLREQTSRLNARPASPGVYRFEAWLEGAPWVFTNQFYLR